MILTPGAPKSGQSYYNIIGGWNLPAAAPSGVSWIFANKAIGFSFATIPGKIYMVDLSVHSFNQLINVSGAYNGSASPVDGHIFVGFSANSLESWLILTANSNSDLCFYRCELTQVNWEEYENQDKVYNSIIGSRYPFACYWHIVSP
ncbi:MAG: hypothetical protein MZV70_08250 [Desulfobacterales bacterium]|nr:hypothetical protein [Desulfobacterales bacterium]